MRIKFEKLIAELKNNPIITLVKAEIGDPIPEEMVKSVMKYGGINEIPSLLMEFYTKVGYIDIYWKCNIEEKGLKTFEPGETELSGEINIKPLESLLVEDEKYTHAYRNEFLDEEAEDLPLFRALDYHDCMIYGFIKDGDKIPENFYYIQDGSDGFGISEITLNDYFDAIFEFKGFNGWQHDITFAEINELKRMNHYMKQLLSYNFKWFCTSFCSKRITKNEIFTNGIKRF